LPVITDEETARRSGSDTIALARQYGLTIYDAAYLELAMRRGASLATTDRDLTKAAKAAGVSLFP
jgi:predicted nucleic acid-binding protein